MLHLPAASRATSQPSEVLPFPVSLLCPPYQTPLFHAGTRVPDTLVETPGGIFCLHLQHPIDWSAVEQAVSMLRRRCTSAPIVLLARVPVEETFQVSSHAMRLRIRAVVLEGQPIRETLRRSLTDTAWLADDVVEWLALRGARLSPAVRHLIGRIFSDAPQHQDVTSLLRENGTPESTARFQLHKRLLPPPGRWFQAARALHAALRIQAEPDTSLLSLALSAGYSDHSSLCHQLQRVFRLRSSALRTTLGWEWLLDRWFRRCAGGTRRIRRAGAPAAAARA